MKSIDVLLIGDIHFPQSKIDLDYKDVGIDSVYAERIATSSLRVVINKVVEIARGTDAIFFCGDLTSWGDIAGYASCVDWLNESLGLSKETFWSFDHIHIVPGNHDLDREKCKPGAIDEYEKFTPFVDALRKYGLDSLLTLKAVRDTSVSKGGTVGRLLSLNSCYGCGEFRSLPPKVRQAIQKQLAPTFSLFRNKNKSTTEKRLLDVFEQMDSPSFVGSDIDRLTEVFGGLRANEVPIVLSHHNILPQQTTRMDLYTELPNSGAMRMRLAGSESPIIYAHGHIHADPIEIVLFPESGSTPLICVSAPEFRAGFNVLRIVFGSKSTPLGLEVIPYRVSRGNTACEPNPSIRIPFWKATSMYSKCSKDSLSVYSELSLNGKVARFQEVEIALAKLRLSRAKIQTAIQELEWVGLLNIANRDHDVMSWQVRGAI